MAKKKITSPAGDVGQARKAARASAVAKLRSLKGKNITTMTPVEQRELLTLIMKWIGLADENGVI